MDSSNVSCPVCTLFLRPGITLKAHLSSHPKHKVIEALVRLSHTEELGKVEDHTSQPSTSSVIVNQWNQDMPPNNVIIYQQTMTSTQQAQQYVIPTIINPPLPYFYQQQVIMSGFSQMRALPYESNDGSSTQSEGTKLEEIEEGELETPASMAECPEEDFGAMEAYESQDDKACQTVQEEVKGQDYFYVEPEVEEIYTEENILQNERYVDFEMEGMQVVINDFPSCSVTQVENFETEERDNVLMTIGEMSESLQEESRESGNVNMNIIRADEKMPPKGELSGQESLSSDMTWQREGTSYQMLEDSSDVEVPPPLQSRDPHFIPPVHEEKRKTNEIGSEIGKNKVKKLVVKFKTETKTEDFVFTNKLKVEEPDEVVPLPKEELKTVCPLCDCVLLNARALREHKVSVHNLSPQTRHKCATCDEQFPNDYKFSEHLRIHPLECKICGRLFYRRQNIQLHMRRHLGIKPYKCEVCIKSFLTKQKLDEHRNIHTGDAPIKCPLCEETFRRHSNLVQHRNRHHLNLKKKVKDYICFCKEVFHSKKKLAWHKEIHDAKPKSCAHCNEKFIHMSSLTRHTRRAHNDKFLPNGHKNPENVECPICKGVYLKSSLEVHIRNHSGQRPYSCLICNKDFTTKWNLKLHKWTHASRVSKPFKCDQCKGAFIRESDYVAHMNSHKSIRPYTCNYCGAQFIRKYNCQRHVKEHENEKMFNCKVCGKSFHRSYYLKDHMRIHSGLRPYSCHICGKTSTTKSNHNKHVQIHHAREPVSTEN